MFKKITSLFTVFCLSLTLIIPVSAETGKREVLSLDTVVTEDNIEQVVEYLGFDPGDLIKKDNSLDVTITVGELKQAVDQLQQLPTEIQAEELTGDNLSVAPLAFEDCVGHKMLYYTTNLGGSFELEYAVGTNYSWSQFTGITYTGVDVLDVDNNLFTTFTIDGHPTVTAKISSNKNKIDMSSDVTVNSYLSVGEFALIHIATTNVKTSKSWSASSVLPGCV